VRKTGKLGVLYSGRNHTLISVAVGRKSAVMESSTVAIHGHAPQRKASNAV
jgi:hypothetical protein